MPPRASRPEVLAPAGDAESLRAAVHAGADAVYFGLQAWNARARATNFDEDTLGDTMRFLHDHGVNGYVTLNTLAFDDELAGVESAVRAGFGEPEGSMLRSTATRGRWTPSSPVSRARCVPALAGESTRSSCKTWAWRGWGEPSRPAFPCTPLRR